MERACRPDNGTSKGNSRGRPGLVAILGGGAGLVLFVIGIRFLVVPEQATRNFGIGPRPAVETLDAIIGLRDLWLGGLAVAFALLREWRALAVWLTMGAGVCVGDAWLVAAQGGPRGGFGPAFAFHAASGAFCAAVGWRCWRLAGARRR